MRASLLPALFALASAVAALAQTPAPAPAQSAASAPAGSAAPLPAPTPIPDPPKPPALTAEQVGSLVVDIATRKGATLRFLYLTVDEPKAAVVLLTGGHGGLQIKVDGSIGWGESNFLARSRVLLARYGLAVALIDAPSDRQSPPFLDGARGSAEHLADVGAVIAWLRAKNSVPVWLIGTSRGTQSVGHFATEVPREAGGADGIVLASSITYDPRGVALPWMALERIAVPALLVHHKDDRCWSSPYEGAPAMMERLHGAPRRALITAEGGRNHGDPCGPFAYHGFNGLEAQVVSAVAQWMVQP